jgi:hypothetical protein
MKETYTVEYTKFNGWNTRKVKETRYDQSLDDVFEILRYSNHCKNKKGVSVNTIAYKDGTICETNGLEENWINQDISITKD